MKHTEMFVHFSPLLIDFSSKFAGFFYKDNPTTTSSQHHIGVSSFATLMPYKNASSVILILTSSTL
jgi:hypothetical protein